PSSCPPNSYARHRSPPPFPPRRSSDLLLGQAPVAGEPPRAVDEDANADPLRLDVGDRLDAAVLRHHVLVALDDEEPPRRDGHRRDRKSTRLNSSHGSISYAVFCLKKKT